MKKIIVLFVMFFIMIGGFKMLPDVAYGWHIVKDAPKTSPYNHTAEKYGGNRGIIEPHLIGYVTPNVGGPRYNHVIVFGLRKNMDPYRAMADIENFVMGTKDSMYAMGYLHGGVIIISLDTNDPYSAIATKYARASHLTRVCRVYSRDPWDFSNLVNDIIFGTQPVSVLCR